jgi:hypothetical protein
MPRADGSGALVTLRKVTRASVPGGHHELHSIGPQAVILLYYIAWDGRETLFDCTWIANGGKQSRAAGREAIVRARVVLTTRFLASHLYRIEKKGGRVGRLGVCVCVLCAAWLIFRSLYYLMVFICLDLRRKQVQAV